MADRIKQIQALLSKNDKILNTIEKEYNSIIEKNGEISDDLRIDIKNYFENLYSILQYMAHEIYEKYCPKTKGYHNVYFPITNKNSNKKKFEDLINGYFPNLKNSNLTLYNKLESLQFFYDSNNEWLLDLNTIVSKNKHEELSYQKKELFKSIELIVDGSKGRINEGGIFRIKEGITLKIGDLLVTGPYKFSTDKPPESFDPRMKLKHLVWIEFSFDLIDESVIPFLRKCLIGIKIIYEFIFGKKSTIIKNLNDKIQKEHKKYNDKWAIRDYYNNLEIKKKIISKSKNKKASVIEIKLIWKNFDGEEKTNDIRLVAPKELSFKKIELDKYIEENVIKQYKIELEQNELGDYLGQEK
jgi:hypothetical protein